MELDKNGLNTAISATSLSDEEMRNLDFTDHDEKNWYKSIYLAEGITLNVSIPKDGSRLRIEVLDEDFGQHYDYQRILKNNPKLEFALRVKNQCETYLDFLAASGVIHGFKRGMYV